ncbi:unnamed protein product [Miscanthus lutarioriparius]|uniref:Myb/SANT-like domain-containing protein n=1 Tax=Miscanthus lutarioriparius TaxID=422564 RepID=A0A811RTH0_9POAL|nr:unnamed protein product [Miscanthus lutarioriparius]
MHHGDEGWLRNQPDNIPPDTFVAVYGGDNIYNNDVSSFNSQIENGNSQRDAIALSMNQAMLGRGSPKLLMQQAGSMKKKKRASPKAGGHGLEKALVEMLHDHNSDCYRGQNGWTTDLWNRIVKLFHAKFKHVSFSRQQIQDKEKELKREYRMLKEVRKQSGASWDEKLSMIVADEPTWDNIITVISLKNPLPPNYVTVVAAVMHDCG